ncbi:MAG: hypothetical protein ABH857_05420 [Elusimicrobiota bacterium]
MKHKTLVLLSAMKWEMKDISKNLKKLSQNSKNIIPEKKIFLESYEINNTIVYTGCMGVGKNKVVKNLSIILNALPENIHIVFIGLAGAVVPQLNVGDCVMPCKVINDQGSIPVSEMGIFLEGVFSGGEECPSKKRTIRKLNYRNAIVTTNGLADKNLKTDIKNSFQEACLVDMESWHAALFCRQHNVSFSILKGISDDYFFVFPMTELLPVCFKRKGLFHTFRELSDKGASVLDLYRCAVLYKNCLKARQNLTRIIIRNIKGDCIND